MLEGHENWLRGLDFSRDGRVLVSGSWDKTIRFWDPAGGKQQDMLEVDVQVEDVAFSPDDKLLAYAGGDHKVVIRDLAARKRLHTVDGNAVEFSGDGRLVATTHGVWQTGDGTLLYRTQAWPMDLAKDRLTYAAGAGEQMHLYPLDFSWASRDPQKLLELAERQAGRRLEGFRLKLAE